MKFVVICLLLLIVQSTNIVICTKIKFLLATLEARGFGNVSLSAVWLVQTEMSSYHKYWIDCHEIFKRQAWSPEDGL